MSQIQLLSMDFDGTLVRHWASPTYPDELVRLLNQLRRNGVFLAFNTGRTIRLVEEALQVTGFPVRPDFALTSEREVFRWNGSLWEDYGEWNSRCREEHDSLFANCAALLVQIERHLESTTAARLHYDENRFSGVVSTTNAEMDEICRFIETKRFEFPDFAYQRNSIYLRFCHLAYNKGTALAELQRLIGIPSEATFAAGDNFNDLPMLNLTFARFLACPSNALEEVKATVRNQGGFVASQDSGFGICEALRYFFPNLP
ncbi:MAG: HAD family phosphatase [Verrucomicrobia bacterium]|nr:HAD family phosphatase [Verrucomicrobiota bacterium]